MEQQDKPDISDDYEAIILKDSVAKTTHSSGVTWKAIYNSTNDTYEFRNWKNANISIGFFNIWYVTGAGNTNMNINSNVDVKLTSTGQPDEYYITQVTPAGIAVTLARVDHIHDSTTYSNGNLTSWPMTWYEFPNLAKATFIIRLWDSTVDPALDSSFISVNSVNMDP